MRERVVATYWIETPGDPEKAAGTLAGEQSSGTFVSVPGETEELKTRFAARVEDLEIIETVDQPSLGGLSSARNYTRANVRVSWSTENFGQNIPALISTLQGNLYELPQFTGLKLDDFTLPDSFTRAFPGPAFGVEGTRRLTGVPDGRPMIGTIIKPSVGLTPEATAELVKTLAEAGIDFVKDDELMTSTANSPFEERLGAIMRVINEHADQTGKKIMYACNISGDLDTMRRQYDQIVAAEGTCAMISVNPVGWTATHEICRHGKLAVHGHRNGWGMLNRHPWLGMNFPAYEKIWRLAGVDQLHVNGIDNKFYESNDSVVRSIKSCLTPFCGNASIVPVVSSGQWGGQAFETYRRTRTTDILYLAGGGIKAHPGGPADGVRALKEAWQGAVDGLSLKEAATVYETFGRSVAKFGKTT